MRNKVLPISLALAALTVISCGGGGGGTGGGGTTATTGTTSGTGNAHLKTDLGPISDATPVIEADSSKMRISWYHMNNFVTPILVMNLTAPIPTGSAIPFTTPGGRASAETQGDLGFFATQGNSGAITFSSRAGGVDAATFIVTTYDLNGNPLQITGDFKNVPEQPFGSHNITG